MTRGCRTYIVYAPSHLSAWARLQKFAPHFSEVEEAEPLDPVGGLIDFGQGAKS